MSDFRKALLWTLVVTSGLPVFVLAVSLVLSRFVGVTVYWFYILLGPFSFLSTIGLGAAVVLYFAGRRETGKGMAIGAGIGIVVNPLVQIAIALVQST